MERLPWTIVIASAALILLILVLTWMSPNGGGDATSAPDAVVPEGPPFRIGLIPERDIFEQRRRYRLLGDYVSRKIDRPIEIVTATTYEGILSDFQENAVDAAFLGSFVSVLVMDRFGAQVLVKPELPGGVSTYRGVIFVTADSPVLRVEDLAGRRVAMLRTTTAGDLFPIYEFIERGLWGTDAQPQIHWSGTHDEVVRDVLDGHCDAGAAKDLRLAVFEGRDPQRQIRRISESRPVPNNALLVHPTVGTETSQRLRAALLAMEDDEAGREVLAQFGAVRFIPCSAVEYGAVFDMLETLGSEWDELGVSGPPPVRPGPNGRG